MTEQISLMEMLRRVQQGIPIEGSYLYKRIDKDEFVPVSVENIYGEMYVIYSIGWRSPVRLRHPVRLRDILIDATFEPIE